MKLESQFSSSGKFQKMKQKAWKFLRNNVPLPAFFFSSQISTNIAWI